MDILEFVQQVGDAPFKAAILVAILHSVRELTKMRKSVEQLNLEMSRIIERISGHEKRISNLEKRKSNGR